MIQIPIIFYSFLVFIKSHCNTCFPIRVYSNHYRIDLVLIHFPLVLEYTFALWPHPILLCLHNSREPRNYAPESSSSSHYISRIQSLHFFPSNTLLSSKSSTSEELLNIHAGDLYTLFLLLLLLPYIRTVYVLLFLLLFLVSRIISFVDFLAPR